MLYIAVVQEWRSHGALGRATTGAQVRATKRHLDVALLKIRGKRHWAWRAADQDGVVLDILVQERRDQASAERFLRCVLQSVVSTSHSWSSQTGRPATRRPSLRSCREPRMATRRGTRRARLDPTPPDQTNLSIVIAWNQRRALYGSAQLARERADCWSTNEQPGDSQDSYEGDNQSVLNKSLRAFWGRRVWHLTCPQPW